jgi:hypothetical protein
MTTAGDGDEERGETGVATEGKESPITIGEGQGGGGSQIIGFTW